MVKRICIAACVVVTACFMLGGGCGEDDEYIRDGRFIGTWWFQVNPEWGFDFVRESAGYKINGYVYSMSFGGDEIFLDAEIYTRTAGSGTTLEGTWEDATGEWAYTFEADNGFYLENIPGRERLLGEYSENAGILKLVYPFSYKYSEDELQLRIAGKVYDDGAWHSGLYKENFEYSMSGDMLTIVIPDDGPYLLEKE